MKPNRALLFWTLTTFLFIGGVTAQEKSEKLGQVNFPVSCNAAAQMEFSRAVTLLHNFVFGAATEAFTAITAADPGCAMGYWGIAMTLLSNPLSAIPGPPILQKGWAAVEQAKSVGATTEREREYIAAIEAFYKDWDRLDHPARALAYAQAMERVYLRYPEDQEAAAFYALALNAIAPPDDKTYTNQLKAATILEKVLAKEPDHPGALHYLIHSYDYPTLATRGGPAARRYASVAASAPHALHMPSHIFSMLGLWQDSIQSNRASSAKTKELGGGPPLHSMDFLMHAYLQGAQDLEAKRVLDERNAIQRFEAPRITIETAHVAIAARYALERRAWADAASLEPRESRYPYAEAITHFARAIGAVRGGHPSHAQPEVNKLQSLRDVLIQSKQSYWAEQTEILWKAASAWLAHAEGKDPEALKLMRSAADLEDASGKHVAMENPLWPMRELLGELLLKLKQPAQALREFEASLKAAPDRFHGLYGAGRAAELSGDREKARSYYVKLIEVCEKADTERPELKHAKSFMASR